MSLKKCRTTGAKCAILGVLLYSYGIAAMLAQNRVDTTKIYELDRVHVEASKPRFSVISPLPAQTLSGSDLSRINSLSVADAVRYMTGVQLKDYGGIGGLKTVNIRSLGSEHTAVFFDGIQLGNVQNGQVDLGKYSLDNLEEIQLYNGQKSTIFQPARGFLSANSLYLKSRQPRFAGTKSYGAKGSIKGGSFGLVNPSVAWQQKLSDKVSLSAGGEWKKADGKYKYRYTNGVYDTTVVRQNGDIESVRLEAGLHGKVDKGNWNVKVYHYDSERGLPGAIVANKYNHSQRQWDKNTFAQGIFQKAFGEKYELMANAKWSKDYTRYIDPEMYSIDNRYEHKEYYVSGVNIVHLKDWWDVALSTDFVMNTLDANTPYFAYPTRLSYYGVLSTSVRYSGFEVQASLSGCVIDNKVKEGDAGAGIEKLLPVVSIAYRPFDDKTLSFRAFYKGTMRAPTFNDLYYMPIGSRWLKPEYTTQYDLGATWFINGNDWLSDISLQADVFRNRVSDKIVATPSGNMFSWSMSNIDEIESEGVELNATASFLLPGSIVLKTGGGYTYQNTIDISGVTNPDYGKHPPYSPQHSASATVWLTKKVWQLNYSYLYVGEQYWGKNNSIREYMKPWYTSDVGLSWEKTWNEKGLRITGEVNNLFNQYKDIVNNFPMPGRSFRLGLSITI